METEPPVVADLLDRFSNDCTPLGAFAFGAVAACAGAFPAAAAIALVYRFPIPFRGYESGLAAAGSALGAVFFYGILGGFVLLGAAGGIAGVFAHSRVGPQKPPVQTLTIAIVLAVDVGGALLLATLDKLIGPW